MSASLSGDCPVSCGAFLLQQCGTALPDLRGRQNPHRAADTPEHAEHEDDYAGNQPQRREGCTAILSD
jgi:hypothetical protein